MEEYAGVEGFDCGGCRESLPELRPGVPEGGRDAPLPEVRGSRGKKDPMINRPGPSPAAAVAEEGAGGGRGSVADGR